MESVLEQGESCSANAVTLFHMLCSKLKELGLDVTNVGDMVSDGASITLGCNNDVAAKLKAIVTSVIVAHIVCHRLALACCHSRLPLVDFLLIT